MSRQDSLTEILAKGFLAGFLGGQVFLVLGLFRYGESLFSWELPASLMIWIFVRSVALYGLLAGAAATIGTLILAPLFKRLSLLRGWVFPVVFGAAVATAVLLDLLAWRQIALLPGIPLSSPARVRFALIDAGYASLSGLLVFALFMARRVLGGRGSKATKISISGRRAAVATLGACLLTLFAAGIALRLDSPSADPPSSDTPVVVIGIDAATLRIMGPMMRSGELPTFSRFVEEGAWGSFLTYGAAVSPIIWTSMATGKTKDDHGILGWVRSDPSSGNMEPLKSYHRQAKAVWNILSESGRRVGVIDWLLTFPPEEVNGYVVSRLQMEQEQRAFPPEIDPVVNEVVAANPTGDEESPRVGFLARIDRVFDLAERMIEVDDVDALLIFENETDGVQHAFWKYFEPERFDPDLWQIMPDEVTKYGTLIPEVHQHLDERLGRFLDRLGDDTLVIVVSDHGQHAASAPQVWLRLDRILSALGLYAIDGDEVDFANTTAYAAGHLVWGQTIGVNLNLEGREPQGIVDLDGADELARTIADRLRSITLEDGDQLFGPIAVDSISLEPRASEGTDITIQHSQFTRTAAGLDGHSVSIEGRRYPLEEFLDWDPQLSGEHDRLGVFFALGKGVRRGYVGQRATPTALQDIFEHLTDKVGLMDTMMPLLRWLGLIPRATTLDVTPTVLHALGLPIARDMAGRPLTDIIAGEPTSWIDTYEGEAHVGEGQETGESDEELLKRLRSLGYIQ